MGAVSRVLALAIVLAAAQVGCMSSDDGDGDGSGGASNDTDAGPGEGSGSGEGSGGDGPNAGSGGEAAGGDDPNAGSGGEAAGGDDPNAGSGGEDAGGDGPIDPDDPLADGCPDEAFIDGVDFPAAAGADYPDPMVQATCEGDELVVVSNGIPNFEFQAITPAGLSAQDYEWRIPLDPEPAAEMTDVPLLGVTGFAVNGLPFYGPNEGEFPDPFGDPVYNMIVDFCLGHTAQRGDYHFHAVLEECVLGADPGDGPSPIIGFALDGFPIYGPRGCLDAECNEVVAMQSSWETTGDPTTYAWDANACTAESCDAGQGEFLDRCNGRVGPDGRYAYHITSTFPYILGCYRGTATHAGGQGNGQPPGGGGEGGGGEGGGAGTCENDRDCRADCVGDSCVCSPTPEGGNRCHVECADDSDCPQDGFVCGGMGGGICVPEGGPGGGAGMPPGGGGGMPPGGG
jgi:hypothetical protein